MKLSSLAESGAFRRWLVLVLSGVLVGFIWAAPPSESVKPPQNKRSPEADNFQRRSQLSQLARQAERMEDWEGALKLWISLWEVQPGDYSAYSGIKRCYLKLNLYDEALRFLDQAAYDQRSAPGKIDLTLMAGDRVEILLSAGREKEAQEEVTEALRRFSTNPNIYRSLFSVLSKFRRFEQGEAILRKGRDVLGNPYLFAPELAYQAEQRMDWAKATQEHINYLKEDPLRLPSVVNMIAAYMENPGVDSVVNGIIKSHMNSADERFKAVLLRLQGGLQMRQGLYSEAFTLYRQVAAQGDPEDLNQLVEISHQLREVGEEELALQGYLTALQLASSSTLIADIAYQVGKIFQSRELLDSAQVYYRLVLQNNPSPTMEVKVKMELAGIAEKQGASPQQVRSLYQEALLQARRSKVDLPFLERLHLVIAQTYYQEDDLNGAFTVLASGMKDLGSRAYPATQLRWALARLYWHRGEVNKAREVAVSLLNANFKSPVANEALDLIELLESLADDTLSASQLGRVDYLIMTSRWEEVDRQIDSLLNSSSFRAREEANWFRVKALVAQRRFWETLETLERLSQPNEGTLKPDRALWEAGSIALYQLGDTARAISYWDALLVKYPLSPLAPQVRHQLQALLTPQL